MLRRAPVVFCFLFASKKKDPVDDAQFFSPDRSGVSGDGSSGNGTGQQWRWDDNWDKRNPECLVNPEKRANPSLFVKEVEKETSTAKRNLFLIRHGQYHLNGKEKCLTELGRKQAELCGKRLASYQFKYARRVSSAKCRAIETADIVQQFLPNQATFVRDPLLDEGAPVQPDPPKGWRPESYYLEDGARIEAAFRKYFHRALPSQKSDSYEVIVCHANVIRYFVCRALQLPPDAWLRMSLAHCSITWIQICPSGRVVLRQLGDHGFLPVDMISYK